MQNIFKFLARLFYYVFIVAALISIGAGIWFMVLLALPTNAPGSEFSGLFLGTIFLPFTLVTFGVEFIIFKVLKKFTDPKQSQNTVATSLIAIMFLIILAFSCSVAYVYFI
ncbi:MAG TPA: hypothetical protein VM124_03235 [Candidatus Limnocylindrales bacterium]|nr:hypothetical protein [Candidatus Limnocylindrales bacterium]